MTDEDAVADDETPKAELLGAAGGVRTNNGLHRLLLLLASAAGRCELPDKSAMTGDTKGEAAASVVSAG